MVKSRSSNNHRNPRHAQPAQNGEFRHETVKAINYDRVDQPPDIRGLTAIRPVKVLLLDALDYRNYRIISRIAEYDGED